MPLPRWVKPQLSKLATAAPTGREWVHEIKFDGYRMAARIEKAPDAFRTRLDRQIPGDRGGVFAMLNVKSAYHRRRAVRRAAGRGDRIRDRIQQASDSGGATPDLFRCSTCLNSTAKIFRASAVARAQGEVWQKLLAKPPAGVMVQRS